MMESIKKIEKVCSSFFEKPSISNLLVIGTFLFAAVYFCMGSVLHPWSVKLPSLDSAVWLRCGVGMLQGETIYIDLWDHKGPVLFLIHYIGLNLTPNCLTGLWILECVSLFFTFVGLYLVAGLITGSKLVQVVSVLGSMHGFIYYFSDGAIVEEWALPFLSFSLYFFCNYLKTKEIKPTQIFLSGAFCIASFLLNGNLISVWTAFIVILLVVMIYERNWKHLAVCCKYFLFGFLLVAILVGGILAAQGALPAFFKAYFGFNNSYISGNTIYNYYSAVMNTAYRDSWFGYVHIGLLILLLHEGKFDWKYSAFFYSVVTLVLLNMSGRQYEHYAMQLIPCMIIPITAITEKINIWCKNKKELIVILLLMFIFWGRFEVSDYTEKIYNTMNPMDRNDYAGGNVENYRIVNEWLNYRWSEEQIEEWVINDF